MITRRCDSCNSSIDEWVIEEGTEPGYYYRSYTCPICNELDSSIAILK